MPCAGAQAPSLLGPIGLGNRSPKSKFTSTPLVQMCKCLCTKRSDQLQFKKILSGQREAVVFDKFDEDRNAVVAAGLVTR